MHALESGTLQSRLVHRKPPWHWFAGPLQWATEVGRFWGESRPFVVFSKAFLLFSRLGHGLEDLQKLLVLEGLKPDWRYPLGPQDSFEIFTTCK